MGMITRLCHRTLRLLCLPALAGGAQAPAVPDGWAGDPAALSGLTALARSESDLRIAVNRYLADKAAIERRYEVLYSTARAARLQRHIEAWQRQLAALDFGSLNREGQLDFVLLRDRLAFDRAQLDLTTRRWEEMAPLLPFADSIRLLQEERHNRVRAEPAASAARLDWIAREARSLAARGGSTTRSRGRTA